VLDQKRIPHRPPLAARPKTRGHDARPEATCVPRVVTCDEITVEIKSDISRLRVGAENDNTFPKRNNSRSEVRKQRRILCRLLPNVGTSRQDPSWRSPDGLQTNTDQRVRGPSHPLIHLGSRFVQPQISRGAAHRYTHPLSHVYTRSVRGSDGLLIPVWLSLIAGRHRLFR